MEVFEKIEVWTREGFSIGNGFEIYRSPGEWSFFSLGT
jgi:hypothetical protein